MADDSYEQWLGECLPVPRRRRFPQPALIASVINAIAGVWLSEAHLRYVMIAIGGALGSILRYQVSTVVQSRIPVGFPYGTFVVNMTACVIMGFAMTLLTERLTLNPNWRFLIPIGFIGAYSTFSTLEYETFRAVCEGAGYVAAANVALSFVAGYLALWCGAIAAKQIF